MRIKLLGSMRIVEGGAAVDVRGAKERALLALLALHAGHVVSDDRVLEELWGDQLPAHPANALQKRVSELRKLVGTDRIRRQGDGYVLDVSPLDVDVAEFEARAAEGRATLAAGDASTAARMLGDALGLWEGPPLMEFADLGFARSEAVRLDELRLAVIEARTDAELAIGAHGSLVGELAALVEEYPLREGLCARLMLALYRSGRQAEALHAYQGTRRVLGEELGLEPGPELRALEAAILAHDPALGVVDGSVRHGNLPARVTSFVGRTAELRLVHQQLARHRVVTLTGPGGAGKTRLAFEAAARLSDPPDGGVWVAELAPFTDGMAVPEALAHAIGARDAGRDDKPIPPTERVIAQLGSRRALVILDNCEHVLDHAAHLAATIVSACPEVRVLTTSREPLGIAGEAQVVVPPLHADEAEQLFVERAAAIDPGGAADMSGNPAVVEVCERLDGLPLAIELAAARVRSLPVEHIAARLDDRFRLLTGGSRTALRRQQTLRATVDWSYELLFEHERALFNRLAVFAGGFDLAAASAVYDDDDLDATDVEDMVGRLVDKSLVAREGARYRILETLRQYALERLADTGAEEGARRAHAQWCDALVDRAVSGFRGPEQLVWLDRLDVEHDNIRGAFDWALGADPVLALRVAAGVAEPWRLRGHRQEARHLLELALRAAGPDTPPLVRSDGLLWAGFLAGALGWMGDVASVEDELALAQQRQEEAIALAARAGDAWRAASHERYLVVTLVRSDSYGGATTRRRFDARLEDAAAVLCEHDDDWGLALTWIIQAWSALGAGDLDVADRALERARPYLERCGDWYTRERFHVCSAVAAELRGDPDTARLHDRQALALARELGFDDAVASHLAKLEQLGDERNDDPEWAADGLASEERSTAAAGRNRLAAAALADGDLPRAASLYREALVLYRQLGLGGGIAASEAGLRAVAAAHGAGDQPD